MACVAYVDHSFHAKTKSTQFLPDMLRRRGHTVDFFWDEEWNGGAAVPFCQVEKYDVVIMFQCRCAARELYFRQLHPNVIYIPMLDSFGIANGPLFNLASHWESFQGCKILSFSSAVHSIVTAFGLRSLHVRYYQESVFCSLPVDGPRGFFWIRHENLVSWPMVRTLLGDTAFTRLHVHIAPDPGSPALSLPTKEDRQRYNITTSTWFENKEDLLDILEQSNIYFAPRREEGIGQSFLEAMARGQCVVAPDNGTMNEYILHGVNGLLYSHDNVAPLDFSRWAKLGKNAQCSVEYGIAHWHEQEQRLIDFIFTPSEKLYHGFYLHAPLVLGATTALAPVPTLRQRIRRHYLVRKTERYWLPIWRRIKTKRTTA